MLGTGADAVPALVALLDELGVLSVTVLCLVELDGAGADRRLAARADVRRARWPARAGGWPRCCSGPADQVPAGPLGSYGVTEAYVIEPEALDGYAPQAWARALAGLASRTVRQRRAGGGHRPRQRGARPPGRDHRPADGGELRLGRGRGRRHADRGPAALGGLLLEDAVLDGSPALLTVATDAVPPVPAESAAEPDRAGAPARPGPGRPAGPAPSSAGPGRRGVAGHRPGGGRRRPRRRRPGRLRARWRNWPACSAAWSACPGW